MNFRISDIGHVRGGRRDAEDDRWDGNRSRIELDASRFGADALAGLSDFSHAEIVFVFDQVAEANVTFGSRHPRDNPAWPKVGVFAQRFKGRPNRIGVSICRIVSVEGLSIEVAGLDAIDGSPVLDVKPVMTGFLPRGDVFEPDWASQLMAAYW